MTAPVFFFLLLTGVNHKLIVLIVLDKHFPRVNPECTNVAFQTGQRAFFMSLHNTDTLVYYKEIFLLNICSKFESISSKKKKNSINCTKIYKTSSSDINSHIGRADDIAVKKMLPFCSSGARCHTNTPVGLGKFLSDFLEFPPAALIPTQSIHDRIRIQFNILQLFNSGV